MATVLKRVFVLGVLAATVAFATTVNAAPTPKPEPGALIRTSYFYSNPFGGTPAEPGCFTEDTYVSQTWDGILFEGQGFTLDLLFCHYYNQLTLVACGDEVVWPDLGCEAGGPGGAALRYEIRYDEQTYDLWVELPDGTVKRPHLMSVSRDESVWRGCVNPSVLVLNTSPEHLLAPGVYRVHLVALEAPSKPPNYRGSGVGLAVGVGMGYAQWQDGCPVEDRG